MKTVTTILFALIMPAISFADKPSCIRADIADSSGAIHSDTIKCDAGKSACYHKNDEKFRNVNCYKKSN
jgi:hypothetical protein